MWQKKIKKTVFTLNIDNYAPELTELTYPFIRHYAEKIGAEVYEINERKCPQYTCEYEKLQIYDLAQKMENDWNIYIDLDALIHPELFDMTDHIAKDTALHIGADMGHIRWTYDRFFRRDGRHIGSCNWFACASDWNIELWKPLDDISVEEAIKNIHPLPLELNTVVTAEHLITDYTLSRNIAKYGLKFTTFNKILEDLKMTDAEFFYHIYLVPLEEKISNICNVLKNWYLHSLGMDDEKCKPLVESFSKLPIAEKRKEAKKIISEWKI